jgi:hypothetical protein
MTVYTGSMPSGVNGGPTGTGYNDNQRPNRVAGVSCSPSSGPDEQILNPDAYTLNGFELGKVGTSKRGDCNGPGYFQTDLSFYKNFHLRGRTRFQFRWDIFNIFNNTNFLLTGLDNTFGVTNVVFDNADPSQASTITSAQPSGSFGQATRTRDPRQMQIGFKILF